MTDKPVPTDSHDPLRLDLRIFMMLIITSILVYLFGVPVSFAVLVLAPMAMFFGIRALVRSKGKSGIAATQVSLSFGLVVCVMGILAGVGQLAVYDLIQDQAACESRALTNTAQRACAAEFEQAYRDRFADWGIPFPGANS